jgi:choline dehydrogenase
MMYVRGQPANFNDIAQKAIDDWSSKPIGAAYRALEIPRTGSG